MRLLRLLDGSFALPAHPTIGEDGDGGSGGTTPPASGSGTPPAGSTDGQQTPPAGGNQSGWRPPASEEEFNDIIERRLGRERGSLARKLEAAGFSNAKIDEVIEAAKAKREVDRQSQSAVEAAQTDLAQAQQALASLNARLRSYEIRDAVTEYLREKHPDYVGRERYIVPIIELDGVTDDDGLTKAVKKAADLFVKDNPIATAGAPGSTPGADRSGATGDATKRQLVGGIAQAMMGSGPMRLRTPLGLDANGRT